MGSKIIIWLGLLLASTVTLSSNPTFSQEVGAGSGEPATAGKRTAIIDKITEVFSEYYPLPDVAREMTGYIAQKRDRGEYDDLVDISSFTAQLTADLRSISHDDHIKVWPFEVIPEDLLAETQLGSPVDNYGFRRVERLPGNIGYLELLSFNNSRTAGPTAIAAMNFLAHCDALIIDLRLNGGGDDTMARLLSSYFFDKSTHLADAYSRKDDVTEQVWTEDWVPGPRLPDIPIYILLSHFSYSSSEWFAYSLQQLKRAVIVGEKTRGGAYAVTFQSYPELSINLKVPYIQNINPYSKTDYSDGVIPDIQVPAESALIVAEGEATKKLLEAEADSDKRYELEWVSSSCSVDLKPVELQGKELSEYVGAYKNVQIAIECGKLYLQRSKKPKQELVPMGGDLFKYRDPAEAKYRVQFMRGAKNRVVGLYDLDSDGDQYPAKMREGK